MRPTFEEYYLELTRKAEQHAQEAEIRALVDNHLRNLKSRRSVQRPEDAKQGFWQRLFVSLQQVSCKPQRFP